MDDRRLLRRLRAAGFSLRVKSGGGLGVSPASRLTEWTEALIRGRKDKLRGLLLRGVELSEEETLCMDCDARLPLGGVRCPACRDRLDTPTCVSCGVEVPAPRFSAVCSLCSLEAGRLARAAPDPSSEGGGRPEPGGVCRDCGTEQVGPSAEVCGRCRRAEWEEEQG